MLIDLREINKKFDNKPVLHSISLGLAVGEIVVLLGPSGCGKTTLLRIIAGLEQPDNGRIFLDGQDLSQLPVHQRGFGFVFQDYALFPHRNVFQNVAFGLRMLNWEQAQTAERVNQVLALVGLGGFGQRPIHVLSGGEKQRVALARSLAPAPRLLLLDEPLGALDRALRERLMVELRRTLKQAGGIMGRPEGITAIYVTHDQAEAFAIADRVVVMNAGRIEQVGSPTELHRGPATAFVAQFLGMENLLEGELLSLDPWIVRTVLGDLEAAGLRCLNGVQIGDAVTVLIRPEAGQPAGNRGSPISGRLQDLSFRGRYQIATIAISSSGSLISLKLEFDSTVPLPEIGSQINIVLDNRSIVLLKSC